MTVKNKKINNREVLKGFTAGMIDPKSFVSASEFSNPAKFFDVHASDQADLNFVLCVLTEEGTNNNGQHFTQDLILSKYMSARLKPFNIGHEKTEIIGTMYDSCVADENNVPIPDDEISIDSETGELSWTKEGKVRVLVAAALYKMIGRDEVNRIVADVKEGKKVDVSMEAWFNSFDYLLTDTAGKAERIKANENTEYLEEYYGGIFNGRTVAKAYHKDNFLWGGIGKVDTGACPASVFLAAAELKENHKVKGPSAFDDLNIKSVESLYSILSNQQKEQLNKLVSASNNKEGANEMKVKKLDKNGQPVLDAEGNQVYDEVSSAEPKQAATASDSFASTIQGQADVIANQNLEIKNLEKVKSNQESEIKTLESKIDTAKAEEKERADKLESELTSVKKEAKASSYLLKLAKDHSDLSFGDEATLREKFGVEAFDDKAFDAFVSEVKADKANKETIVADLKKKTVCEMFGLDFEKATDEEIQNAQAALKIKIQVENEDPLNPSNTDDSKDAAENARMAASASAKNNIKASSGFKIKTHNTETGKREEIIVQ